jgi:hypothetical protein
MNLKDLSQLYCLERQIQRDERRLEDLRSRLVNISPKLSGMPAKPGASDAIGDAVPAIIDLEKKIQQEKAAFEQEKIDMELFLRRIQDAQLRLIFILRFVDLKSWNEVADEIGGGNTDNSVKKLCYRHLKKSASETCPTWPDEII